MEVGTKVRILAKCKAIEQEVAEARAVLSRIEAWLVGMVRTLNEEVDD